MDIADIEKLAGRGEDSRLQYKLDVRNADALAAEMAAFANCDGGLILIGVADNGKLIGLSRPGLGSLTSAQKALAEFIEVDPDLLAAAGMGSPESPPGPTQSEKALWLDSLPQEAVRSILELLLEGQGQTAERSLNNRFAAWCRANSADNGAAPRRTVAALRKTAEKAAAIRVENKKREAQRREQERRKQREVYLKRLSKDFIKAWKQVQEPVERGSGVGYDEATRLIADIAEAYSLFKSEREFDRALTAFMAPHLRRKTLLARLVRAGLWGKA